MYALSSTIEEKVTVTLTPLTSSENVAPLDGGVTWTVIDGDCTLEPSVDGTSCTIIPNLADSVVTVKATADADLDTNEERFIEETFVYTVVAAEAVGFGVNVTVSPK